MATSSNAITSHSTAIHGATSHSSGLHILADLWGIETNLLCDSTAIESILLKAAKAACATVLQTHLHSFGKDQGVTGVLLLAESHISIHTWPETQFAAIDIFICGKGLAEAALKVIKEGFSSQREQVHRIQRGRPL